MGIQNQLKISSSSAYTVGPGITSTVIIAQRNYNRQYNNYRSPQQNNLIKSIHCPNSGNSWSLTHLANHLTQGKQCKNFCIRNHSVKLVGHQLTNEIGHQLTNQNTYYSNYDSDYDKTLDNSVPLIYSNQNLREVETVNHSV